MTVKYMFLFSCQGYKWAESHYCSRYTLPGSAVQDALGLATLRAQCLGVGAFLREIRISSVPANGLVQDVFFVSQLTGYTPNTAPFQAYQVASPSYNSVLVRIQSATGLHRNLYLAGAPSGLFVGVFGDDNFLYYQGVPYFYQSLRVYLDALTSLSYGWLSRTGGVYVQASGIVQSGGPPAQIGIITQAALPGVVAGGQVVVKGWRRMNVRTLAPLTGVFTVASVVTTAGPPATWTYYLLNTAGVSPTNFFTLGKIAPLSLTYTPYSTWTGEESCQRRRSNPVAGRRGRAPIRG